jgi:dCMP deaminase
MKSNGIDLAPIYQLRNNFTLIGLTGQTGSGCSEVARQLVRGFGTGADFDNPSVLGRTAMGYLHNAYRKHRIIYDYASQNFKPYINLNYKDVLTLFLIQFDFTDFTSFITSEGVKKEFLDSKLPIHDFSAELIKLEAIKAEFNSYKTNYLSLELKAETEEKGDGLYEFYFQSGFIEFSEQLHNIFSSHSRLGSHKLFQIISNNIRKSGQPFNLTVWQADKIYTIAEMLNTIIKSIRRYNGDNRTQVVINSLRNSLEIMFFKQRFSAFYCFAINSEARSQEENCRGKFTMDNWADAKKILREEYKGGADSEFYKQNIADCFQQADVHINFLSKDQAIKLNERNSDRVNDSPQFSWNNQVLKYVSLIDHPGIITPSPEERCMQLAYTAKHNSGCISRHVGAAITDENYSIKAIGWNNTPEGQVPCVLRKTEDLVGLDNDLDSFTPYERSEEFKKVLGENFEQQIKENQKNLKGRNVCFCFKSLKNSYSEGKNQVHTRSLHAEESAFLQISKYGGVGIRNGKLFSTASPCELCSKKVYQLGIKTIYYIDPYPGISTDHILSAGSRPIEVKLFSGAIGNAYHWLYDPMMPYKDELSLILGNEVKDLVGKYEQQIADQSKEIDNLKTKLSELNN